MSLPARGPWVVTPTSSSVDWVVAAAALAATAGGSAAAVVFGAVPEVLHAQVAEIAELPAGTGLDAVAAVVTDLSGRHHRVVVLVDAWIVAPPGGGWTVADLATAVRATVVVVTGTDADATGHTILFLDALDRRQVPGSVIVVGDGGDFAALPVRLAGRIPADHAAYRDTFAAEAARWVDPLDGSQATGAARWVDPPAGSPVAPAGSPVAPAGSPVAPAGSPVAPAGSQVTPAGSQVTPAGSQVGADDRPVTTPGPEDLQTRMARRAAWTLAISFLLALILLFLCQGGTTMGPFT